MTAQTILPANSVTDAYEVANSLRFNSGSSDYLNLTAAGNSTLSTKGTWSTWVKKSTISSSRGALFSGYADASNRVYMVINADALTVFGKVGGTVRYTVTVDQHFRDPSAWMNIVVAIDTTQGTAANRVKIYVNGVQVTSLTNGNGDGVEYPDQNDVIYFAVNGDQQAIGIREDGALLWNGYFSEVVYIDGTQLTPTSFGEFDEDSGIWKPIKVSGLTFGNNGCYLDFKDSSALGNVVAGRTAVDFTVTNLTAVDQTTDTCTNNFATLASGLYTSGATFSQGNLQYQAPGSNPVFGSLTTIGVDNGKWYAEVKYTAGSNHYLVLGIADEVFATLSNLGSNTNTDLGKVGASLSTQAFAQNSTVAYVVNTGKVRNNNANGDYGSGGGDGDIIQIALDRDNRKVYFGINGTYEASGDPGAGSNGFDLSSLVTGDTYFIGVTNDTGASETIAEFNFGSPSFAISSSNADANGIGNFEYAVPSGFFALCTKNLAEFG